MSERDQEKAAYERGYRRGRIEAAAELHAIYRARILEATTILAATFPTPEYLTKERHS